MKNKRNWDQPKYFKRLHYRSKRNDNIYKNTGVLRQDVPFSAFFFVKIMKEWNELAEAGLLSPTADLFFLVSCPLQSRLLGGCRTDMNKAERRRYLAEV